MISRNKETFCLALAKGIMGMTEGWAEHPSSKWLLCLSMVQTQVLTRTSRQNRFLSGWAQPLMPAFLYTPQTSLPLDASGLDCIALSWRQPKFPDMCWHHSRKSPSLDESQYSTFRTENLIFPAWVRELAWFNRLSLGDSEKSAFWGGNKVFFCFCFFCESL